MQHVVGRDDVRALGADRDRGEPAVAADGGDRVVEVVGLVEREQFVVVPEQQVDFVAHERPEVVAVTVDAEGIRQRERHEPAVTVRSLGGVPEGGLGIVAVVEVPLHVQHLAGGDGGDVDIGHAHQARGAEKRVHRALRIGRHDDDAAAGRDALGHRARAERHTDREQVVSEHPAQLVVADLADVGRTTAETGHATHRVGCRATAHLDGRPERPVQLDGAVGADQRHRALQQVVGAEELVARVGDDVDECVADPDDVIRRRRRRGVVRVVGRPHGWAR